MVLAAHLFLAILLFVGINWVGGHARSLGYISLSLFVRRDDAPAFNTLFRVLSPVVFITIVAAILYYVRQDRFVADIWFVVIYYVAMRIGFNVIFGRALLLNWAKEVIHGAVCVGLSWLAYDHFIRFKKTLLPDFATATNELWVFIAVFLYLIFNQIDTGTSGAKRRKHRYLSSQVKSFISLYGHILTAELPDKLSQSVAMSILIYESFNRPPIVQRLEKLVFPRFSKSLGPMQVKTSSRMSDDESVRAGFQKVAKSYARWKTKWDQRVVEEHESLWTMHYSVVRSVAADYNKDDSYVKDVRELHGLLLENFYPELEANPT